MNTVKKIIGPTILLASGNYFDFEAPETSNYSIDDVAHALSLVCRFGGHCAWHYSVAQHSVHVSQVVEMRFAFQALMHDAAEFAVGDMPKPLKTMLPDYTTIEKRVEADVFRRFNVATPLPPEIKIADYRMLATEQRQVMNNDHEWSHRSQPFENFKIKIWSPQYAKRAFLDRYEELRP
jgi:uncharacterized protein